MTNTPDYRYDPANYDLQEFYRPDEVLMHAEVQATAIANLTNRVSVSILDLCCGTGLSMQRLVGLSAVKSILGVDNSPEYLERARARCRHSNKVQFVEADSVDVELGGHKWDLIIMASAYHHIEDNRKPALLAKVRSLLSANGIVIMGENVLPAHDPSSVEDRRRAIKTFYAAVLATAEREHLGVPDQVRLLIERVAQYGEDGDYEYKSSWKGLITHLAEAGLAITRSVRVWPFEDATLGKHAGNYVLTLQSQHSEEY